MRNLILFSAILVFAAGLLRSQNISNLSVKKINYPYHDGTDWRAIFSSDDIKPLPGGLLEAKQFSIRTFQNGDTNQVELMVSAPECIFDHGPGGYSAWSSGPLQVFTPGTNYFIEGRGFLWSQNRTNAHLTISNDVHTIIHRPATDSSSPTNPPIQIYSRHFEFDAQSVAGDERRRVQYTNHVRVVEQETSITCQFLTTDLPVNGRELQDIIAEIDVTLVNEQSQMRATGEKGVYFAKAGKLELTGNPAWGDALREGKADKLIYDRKARTFLAEHRAWMKLPYDAISQPGILASPSSEHTTPPSTNRFAEISSEFLTVQLPPTNGPVVRITAETNVVIISPTDKSRASGERAVYTAATGLIELTGQPRWQIDQSEVRADLLSVGRANRSFHAQGNAYLRLPARFLGNFPSPQANAKPGESANSNFFLEIRCDDLQFENNTAFFRDQVRGQIFDGATSLGTLRARLLSVEFSGSNQVRTITAVGGVFVDQTAGLAPSQVARRFLRCENLMVRRSVESGLIESVVAQGDVFAHQNTRSATNSMARNLQADAVTVNFFARSNQVETFLAERNVFLQQNDSEATGQRAFYRADPNNEILEITGQPEARTDKLKINQASILFWDARTGKFRAQGGYHIFPTSPAAAGKDLSPNP